MSQLELIVYLKISIKFLFNFFIPIESTEHLKFPEVQVLQPMRSLHSPYMLHEESDESKVNHLQAVSVWHNSKHSLEL